MDDVRGWCVCVFHSLLKVVEGLTVWGGLFIGVGVTGERTRVTCLVNTSSTTELHICLSPIIYILGFILVVPNLLKILNIYLLNKKVRD